MKINIKGCEFVIDEKNEIVDRLSKDFSFFLSSQPSAEVYGIQTKCVEDPCSFLPTEKISKSQTINSITYDVKEIRYNDYYGEVLTVIDYKQKKILVYYKNLDKAYEVIYLLILSRSGKFLDRKMLHKIHAMGVSFENKNLILMLPMKGGKTTTFTRFLCDEEINILSDDTPLVDRFGRVDVFPLRIGVEDTSRYLNFVDNIPEKYKYEFNRDYFSKKICISMSYFQNRIGSGNKNVLVCGFRSSLTEPRIVHVGFFRMYKQLLKHMIVGVGLPMVIEYFLESTFKDKIVNLKILFSRALAAFFLALKSQKYFIYLSSDVEKNYKLLNNLIKADR